MNFIKVKDNLLTKQECIEAIDWSYKNKVLKPDLNKDRYTGYDYCDLMDKGEDYIKCFSPSSLRPVYRAIETLKDSYFPKAEASDKQSNEVADNDASPNLSESMAAYTAAISKTKKNPYLK